LNICLISREVKLHRINRRKSLQTEEAFNWIAIGYSTEISFWVGILCRGSAGCNQLLRQSGAAIDYSLFDILDFSIFRFCAE